MENEKNDKIEKTSVKEKTPEKDSSHQILLQNRKSLTMTGITRVDSTNESGISVMIGDTPLEILGNNIHIAKLDVEKGIVELTGEITTIRYDQKTKKNFVKRLFK